MNYFLRFSTDSDRVIFWQNFEFSKHVCRVTYKIAKFHKCLIYFHVKFEPDCLKIDGVMAILLGKRILAFFSNRHVFRSGQEFLCIVFFLFFIYILLVIVLALLYIILL